MNKQVVKTEVTLIFDRSISDYSKKHIVFDIIGTYCVPVSSDKPVRLDNLFPKKPVYLLPIHWRNQYIAGTYGIKEISESNTTLTITLKGEIDEETIEHLINHAQKVVNVKTMARIEEFRVNAHAKLF